MNQNNGYTQTAWLYIWGIIKYSFVYKALTGTYSFFSRQWQGSVITGFFRKASYSDRIITNSLWYKFMRLGITVCERASSKCGECIRSIIGSSAIVRCLSYILHNLLALNLRFIGCLMCGMTTVYITMQTYLTGESAVMPFILLSSSVILIIFDVNVTTYLKSSLIVKLILKFVGTDVNFDYFYRTRCRGRGRLYTAVLLGAGLGAAAHFFSPLYAFIALFGIAGALLILYKPEAGVFTAAFAAPLVPTMALAGICLLTLASFIYKTIITKDFKWRFDITGFLLMSLITLFFISAATSFVQIKSLQIFVMYLVFMSFYFVLTNVIRTEKQLYSLVITFVLSALLVGLYGLAQYFFGLNVTQAWLDESMFEGIRLRIYSTLGNPNVLGEYLLLAIPLSVALAWTQKGWAAKLTYTGIACVLGLAMVLTHSRGCWLGIIAGAAVFVTFTCGKLWGLLLIAAPLAVPFVPQNVLQRFTSIGDMNDSSSSYRVFIWLGTIAMLRDFFVGGIGLGVDAFNTVYPFYSYNAVSAPHSHGLFLQLFVENGILGPVLFLLFIVFLFKKLVISYNTAGKGSTPAVISVAIGAAITGFMIQGLFDHAFYNYRVFMMFWMIAAMGSALSFIVIAPPQKNTR